MPREGFAIAWLQAPPVFTHATILYEALQTWNRGSPKRLNIPPHRRMVGIDQSPAAAPQAGLCFCQRASFVPASFDLKDELHIAAHLRWQIQWNKEPVLRLRI